MKLLGRLLKCVETMLNLMMAVLLAFMVVTVFANVLGRYLFSYPIS